MKCYSRDAVDTWVTYDSHLTEDMKNGPLFFKTIKEPTTKLTFGI
jgi:hypothetical protein